MIDIDFRRGAVLTAVVFLLAGLPACGSGDDDEDTGAAQTPSTQKTTATTALPAPTGTVEEQLAAVVKATQSAYSAGDGDTYCAALTEAGRKEVVDYARGVGQDPSCPGFIEAASRKVRELGITQKPSRIVSVRANGSKATAMISVDKQPPRPTKFVKVDGQWKFVTSGFTGAL